MDQTTKDIRKLIDKLNYFTELYDKGTPQLSDKEWDNLYFQLINLEQQTGIIYPDSPTQSISYTVKSKLDKVIHDQPPMLSLDKTKDVKIVSSFVKGHEWFGMFKMDGLSCRLIYKNGILIQASTRGNGVEGEDVTHNAMVISNIPKSIPNPELIIIDGEIICDLDTFNTEFKNIFANPRNMAAGSIRQLSSKECAARKLSFIAWDLIKGCDDIDFNFRRLEQLDDWGFDTVPRVGDAETIKDAIKILDEMRNEYPYSVCPIDGYVFKFESKKYGESLGRTEHHFFNAIAMKFYDEEYETELLNIDWTMGRTGVLTPVAVFKPVDTGDSIIERASMHNLSIMRELLGRYPEQKQKIWVVKQNMIIPQVSRSEKNDSFHDHILDNGICITCPICGEPTEIVQSDSGVYNVICGNPSCEGKLLNRVDHFLGIKGLNVKGISKATISKLIDWGWINGLADIFRLEQYKTEWISKEGFGAASVGKILLSINAARSGTKMENFLSAIGIPLVGRAIAKEIVKYYPTWGEFRAAIGGDWTEFEGFGPEISRSINNFDYTEIDKIAEILDFVQLEVQNKGTQTAAIKNKTFVITGKVINYKNRDELKAEIESLGGKVASSISSKTDYLINNDINSTSSKNKKAKELGIPIISEEQYLSMRN